MNLANFDGHDQLQQNLDLPLPVLCPQKLVHLVGKITDYKLIYTDMDISFKQQSQLIDLAKYGQKLTASLPHSCAKGFEPSGALAKGVLNYSEDDNVILQPAGYFTAKLNDKAIAGWIGYSKFEEHDEVELVAEWQEDHYEVYAIARPVDCALSLIPIYNKTRKQNIKFIALSIFINALLLALAGMAIGYWCDNSYDSFYSFMLDSSNTFFALLGVFFILSIIVAYKVMLETSQVLDVRQRILQTLGWKNTENISLVEMTNARIKQLKKNEQYPSGRRRFYAGIYPQKNGANNFYYYDVQMVKKTR